MINDELITKYYEENSIKYLIPEKTIVDVVEIDIESFKNQNSININEAEEYYKNNIGLYSKVSRDISFIRFSNENDALKFHDIIENLNEKNLNDYMSENNLKFTNLEKFKGDSFSDDIKDEIFKMDIDKYSIPINYEGVGYYIFKANKVNEKKVAKFNEVRDEISNDLALENAYEDFDEAINIIDEMLINDYSFEEIVKSQSNLKVTKNVNLQNLEERFGENYTSKNNDVPVGFISEIVMIGDVAFVYNVKEKQKSNVPELTEIREIVEADFKNESTAKLISMTDVMLKELKFKNLDLLKNMHLKIIIN